MLQYAGRPRSARVSSAKEVPKVLPMRPELLKGHLDALLLAVLEPGPQHGYAVIEALRTGSGGGRRRRAYHLTASGHAALGEQRAIWDQFSTAVTAVLGGRPWPATV